MEFEFREFKIENQDSCMKIEKDNMTMYEGWRNGDQKLAWAEFYNTKIKYVIYHEKEIIGFLVFSINVEDAHLEFINLQIIPSYQSKGVGKQAFKFVEKIAAENQMKTIGLQVFKDNPAVALYRRLSYEIIGDGEELNSYRMQKSMV